MDRARSDLLPGRDYHVIEDCNQGSSILFISGNHRIFGISRNLGERLRRGLSGLTGDERKEWDALIRAGMISQSNRDRLAASEFSDGANLAVNVNLTSVCNLDCTYCFADGGDYGRITGKLGLPAVDHIFSFIESRGPLARVVRFEFFGGEPLLNFPVIRAISERAEAARRATGTSFVYRISTNLTVLPPGALELFAARRFIVSVSIDGLRETHDRNRPAKNGASSFDRTMANCRAVRAASEEITLVARMTVVGEEPSLAHNVVGLWETDLFDYFQIYPGVVTPERRSALVVLEPGGQSAAGRMTNPTFLRQLAGLFGVYDQLFVPGKRFRGVLEYERLVDLILNGKLALSFCSGGRNYFTFSPDDSIMPCHRLVGHPEFQVGDAKTGLDRPLDRWRIPVDENPICSQCWARYACGGGCKQENFIATGSLETPAPELCAYQTSLLENVVRMLVRRDQAYRARDRAPLDDLFVSCGRPVVVNLRDEEERAPGALRHFQSV